MIKVKLLYKMVTSPEAMEQLINTTLQELQNSGCEIINVSLLNGQALVTYRESSKKNKKTLNEKM